jgi:hypothetical protein
VFLFFAIYSPFLKGSLKYFSQFLLDLFAVLSNFLGSSDNFKAKFPSVNSRKLQRKLSSFLGSCDTKLAKFASVNSLKPLRFFGYFVHSFVRHHKSEVLQAFFRKNFSPTCLKFAKLVSSNYICWAGLVGVRGVWRHQISEAAKFVNSNSNNDVKA